MHLLVNIKTSIFEKVLGIKAYNKIYSNWCKNVSLIDDRSDRDGKKKAVIFQKGMDI